MSFITLGNIQKSFKTESVLKEINLSVSKGELFGLLGPSGSGKTTLVKIIIGLLGATAGTVRINDEKIPSLNVMQNVGYMAQSDALYSELTGRENLSFFANIYKIRKTKQKERIHAVANIVGLTEHLDKKVEHYSGGMKRRMSLAIALLHEPQLLVLDEPTVGIDPVLRASIWEELKELQKQGTTILITTHVMDEAAKCDRLSLLRDGYVTAEGSPTELKERSNTKTLEEAFLYFGSASYSV
ncbi:ABC transporter ATP-binding protein [Virgibacillus sp. W0181]|uniref:ABC transporter ATP-binding protein n=1 Tax=Virgibacillus sp. W0181 TaxID=3391581 RepID=UPI003F46CEB2